MRCFSCLKSQHSEQVPGENSHIFERKTFRYIGHAPTRWPPSAARTSTCCGSHPCRLTCARFARFGAVGMVAGFSCRPYGLLPDNMSDKCCCRATSTVQKCRLH